MLDFQDNEGTSRKMAAAATVFGRFSHPEMLVAHGGRVKTIAAGHYTVTGLSHHLRLGEFVAHQTRDASRIELRVRPRRAKEKQEYDWHDRAQTHDHLHKPAATRGIEVSRPAFA